MVELHKTNNIDNNDANPQEEYNTERFKIAQANAASFRKQSQILEERNAKLNGIVAKHEEASETMRAETMGLQTRLSQVRKALLHSSLTLIYCDIASMVICRPGLNRGPSVG